jgi:hypothetical protein
MFLFIEKVDPKIGRTNSMEQRPSCVAYSRSARQEICGFLGILEVHHCFRKSPPLEAVGTS